MNRVRGFCHVVALSTTPETLAYSSRARRRRIPRPGATPAPPTASATTSPAQRPRLRWASAATRGTLGRRIGGSSGPMDLMNSLERAAAFRTRVTPDGALQVCLPGAG